MIINKYSAEAFANIEVLLHEAITHRCDILLSMSLIIKVLTKSIDSPERLEQFLADIQDEFNRNMLSIIPPASELKQ